MIKSKKMFYTAITLFVASMVLSFPFPHEVPFGETVALAMNIPIQSANGLHYVGITSIVLLITSLFFLNNSMEKYQGRLILLAIILAFSAPAMIVSSFQKTIATGVYAVTYEDDWSNCQFEMVAESTLHGECELTFENNSNKDIQFTIEFYEKYYFEDDGYRIVSLMNESAPYMVSLKGKEKKTVKIVTNIDVTKMEKHIEGGSATGVNIIIKSGGKVRKL